MGILNNILKILGFFGSICWILILVIGIIYISSDMRLYIDIIGYIIVTILDVFLTYLFFKNTILNEKNSLKIFILSIIIIIIGGILYINQCGSVNVLLSIQFFVFYCLPILPILISITFNTFYIKSSSK